MNRYFEYLKKSYVNLTPKDEENFKDIIREDGLGDCKPKFHPYAFLFGWFYLLYKRAVIEAFSVLMIALMIGYVMAFAKIHPVLVILSIVVVNSLIGGFCYYYLYLNKLNRDVDYCGEYNVDIECLKEKTKPKMSYVIIAVIVIIILIWPWIFELLTGYSLKG